MGTTRRESGGLKRISIAIAELDGLTGKVGFFESAKYPDGTPVAYVAAIQEHGYEEGGIPPRSFIRTTIAEQAPEWKRQFGLGATDVANGRVSAFTVMDAVGALAAGDVRKKIASIQSPPLKEGTVAARRRRYADKSKKAQAAKSLSKPLVDTAVLVNSVTHVTERGT